MTTATRLLNFLPLCEHRFFSPKMPLSTPGIQLYCSVVCTAHSYSWVGTVGDEQFLVTKNTCGSLGSSVSSRWFCPDFHLAKEFILIYLYRYIRRACTAYTNKYDHKLCAKNACKHLHIAIFCVKLQTRYYSAHRVFFGKYLNFDHAHPSK